MDLILSFLFLTHKQNCKKKTKHQEAFSQRRLLLKLKRHYFGAGSPRRDYHGIYFHIHAAKRKQEAPRLYKMSHMIKVMSQNLSSCGFLLQVHQETQVAQPSRVLKVYVGLMWW